MADTRRFGRRRFAIRTGGRSCVSSRMPRMAMFSSIRRCSGLMGCETDWMDIGCQLMHRPRGAPSREAGSCSGAERPRRPKGERQLQRRGALKRTFAARPRKPVPSRTVTSLPRPSPLCPEPAGAAVGLGAFDRRASNACIEILHAETPAVMQQVGDLPHPKYCGMTRPGPSCRRNQSGDLG